MTHPPVLWKLSGRVGRGAYLAAGGVLFATKFAIDYGLANLAFGRSWSLIEYLTPGQAIVTLIRDTNDRAFYLTMTAVAVPYILVGLSLTVQRLRDAGASMWPVLLFFMPLGNLFFFLTLCLLKSKPPFATVVDETVAEQLAQPSRTAARLSYAQDQSLGLFPRVPLLRAWPRDDGASAALAILLPIPGMVAMVLLSTYLLRDYGWGLFVGLPFVNGMIAALLHGMRVPRRLGQSLGVATLALIASGLAILVFAIEGLGCLVMFFPLALPIGLFGAALGHAVQNRPVPREARWRVGCSVLGLLPLTMSLEHATAPPAPLFAVTTVVEVDAPPRAVWHNVVTFADIPAPNDWFFRTGVAHPVRARIDGRGPGAIRYCEFSTGAFVEPIRVWDEPKLLKFDVTENPPPMRELTLWRGVHPPHLDRFLVSRGGQFRLTPLPGGRTRLEGTTWYRHHMWPAAYWQLWSDFIIHRIHLRVLNHVKALSEAPAGAR
jgi:uncharacterized membrane protein YhaH (DUF805 family)